MDDIREQLEQAFALDDQAKADFEQWQRTTRSRLEKQHDGFGLVYKTFERPTPQQQSIATMDAEQQKRWNEWVTAHIRNAIHENNKMMVEETAEFVSEYVHKRLKDLNRHTAQHGINGIHVLFRRHGV